MKVRISVSKTEALRAGFDRHGLIVVDVPAASLTPEQREELARWNGCSSDKEVDFCLDQAVGRGLGYPDISEAKPEAVPVILDALIAHRKIAELEKKDQHEAAVQKWLNAPVEDWVKVDGGYASIRGWLDGVRCPEDERLAAKQQEAGALRAKRNAQEHARRDAERLLKERQGAEEKAKKDAGREVLKSWALANGSELLKARIADGFEWEGLAEMEFARSAVNQIATELEEVPDSPEGYDTPSRMERTTPTLEEIQALRSLRKRIENYQLPATVEIGWFVYDPEKDEEFDEDCSRTPEKIRRAELLVKVTCPNGATKEFYFLPATSGAAKAEA